MNTAENGIYQKVSDYLESQGFKFLDFGIWGIPDREDMIGIQVCYKPDDPRWISISPVDTFGESSCQALCFNTPSVRGRFKIYLDQLIFMCKEFHHYTENG